MNWTDSLYWYWRERGGELYTSASQKNSGILLLDMPRGPAFVQCRSVPPQGGRPRWEVTVSLRVSLDRPYYLTVRRETFSHRGEEQALALCSQADDGVAELTARRSVRSSDSVLTPYLLQSPRLQQLLNADPGAWLQIAPMQIGGLVHLVLVHREAESFQDAVDSKGQAAARDVPNQRRLYAESRFREQLDSLVELAQTARDGVDLWPRGREHLPRPAGNEA